MYTESYRDLIKTSAVFLQLDSVASALGSEEIITEKTVLKEIDLLVCCANLVLSEIAFAYIPLKKTEEVKAENNKILFRNLEREIIDVFSLKINGKNAPFRQFHNCLTVEKNGKYEIEYSYAPVKGTLETKLEWEGQKPGGRVIAYGIACEYCLLSGMTDDAAIWDKRFKDALFAANIIKNERTVKRRRWL